MKIATSFLAGLLLIGTLGATATATAADGVISKQKHPPGVIYKQELTPGSYCHLRFPAIREETLSSDHPVLLDPSDGDIIDYYDGSGSVYEGFAGLPQPTVAAITGYCLGGGLELCRSVYLWHCRRHNHWQRPARRSAGRCLCDSCRAARRDRLGSDYLVRRFANQFLARSDRRLCRRGNRQSRAGCHYPRRMGQHADFHRSGPVIGHGTRNAESCPHS